MALISTGGLYQLTAQYSAKAKEADEVNENRLDAGFGLGQNAGGQTDWILKSYTFVTTYETAYIRLRALMGGTVGTAEGDAWFDAVTIRKL